MMRMLAHLKASLTGDADQVLWDTVERETGITLAIGVTLAPLIIFWGLHRIYLGDQSNPG